MASPSMKISSVTITPETRDNVPGFRVTGEGSFLKFLDELVPQLSQAVASLVPASWNRIAFWLKQIDGLRQAA